MSMTKRGPKKIKNPADRWEPLRPASFTPKQIAEVKALHGERAGEDLRRSRVWMNRTYQVNVRRQRPNDDGPDLLHLSVKRRDGKPVHAWRDLQRIKNQLVGVRYEAIEIYPAEDRRVDGANQFHLWAIDDPGFRFPFGFDERLVDDEPEDPGIDQDALDPQDVIDGLRGEVGQLRSALAACVARLEHKNSDEAGEYSADDTWWIEHGKAALDATAKDYDG